jgi:hypothetical protein
MNRRMFWVAWLLCLAGCAGTATEQGSRQLDPGVMATVKGYEAAYNAGDWNGLVALFGEGGHVVVEKRGTGLFSKDQFQKQEFQSVYSETKKRFATVTLGDPYVYLPLDSGDRVVLEVRSRFGDQEVPTKVSLMLVQGRWLIWKIRYF